MDFKKKKPTAEYLEWINSRPPKVKELIYETPPGLYEISFLAPYRITFPGSKVFIHSYTELGEIGVVLAPEHKTARHFLVHLELLEENGRYPDDLLQAWEDWMSNGLKAYVAPEHLFPLDVMKL